MKNELYAQPSGVEVTFVMEALILSDGMRDKRLTYLEQAQVEALVEELCPKMEHERYNGAGYIEMECVANNVIEKHLSYIDKKDLKMVEIFPSKTDQHQDYVLTPEMDAQIDHICETTFIMEELIECEKMHDKRLMHLNHEQVEDLVTALYPTMSFGYSCRDGYMEMEEDINKIIEEHLSCVDS